MKNLSITFMTAVLVLASTNVFSNETRVFSKKSKGVLNIEIIGEDARMIQEKMTKANHTSTRNGSLVNSIVNGKNITCHSNHGHSFCKFSVDENGNLNTTTSTLTGNETASGTAKSMNTKNGLNVTLSGLVSDQILKSMTGVSDTGTMTITKDSGDIKCSKVKEFKNTASASCSFNIDSYGSASSK